jgi:MoxR-like ATPase
MDPRIEAINSAVREKAAFVGPLTEEIHKVIVGQKALVDRLLIGLLARGHLLIEGVPGLAKTLSVRALAAAIRCDFRRIQFTPDLLPADLTGTLIFNQKDGAFVARRGPIFTQILLADEINRAPGKVQSALLEAMQEGQVTIGDATHPLPDPFIVLATQNPIEQEGTYPLPEAQVDRFMLKVKVGYPSREEERLILDRSGFEELGSVHPVVGPADILQAQGAVRTVYMDERIKDYVIALVLATRNPAERGLDIGPLLRFGASPRASMALAAAARAHAFLSGRGYVVPEDVKAIGADVLRHRLILSYEAEAEEVDSDEILRRVFDAVEVP